MNVSSKLVIETLVPDALIVQSAPKALEPVAEGSRIRVTIGRPLHRPARHRQHGATLIIGLILLVLITLIIANAFMLSSTNLKSVGNMQVRDESVAAAKQALQTVVSSAFTDAPMAQEINVDIDKDGVTDYVVAVNKPDCIRVGPSTAASPSDVELGAEMSTGSTWNTDWDIDATVKDTRSGAAVRVRQGVRVLLTQAQKTAVCN